MPKFMKTLNNISRSQSVFRSNKLNVDDICAAHHTFIFAICRAPGSTQEELAKEICLNKSTVTRTLTHLENSGYVRRETNKDDKRSTLVFPTQKMLDLLPKVREIAKEWNSSLAADIDPNELEIFFSVLSRMEQKAKSITVSGEKEQK